MTTRIAPLVALSIAATLATGCDYAKQIGESGGDRIAIDEVRGPSGGCVVGETYEVRGRYRLQSRDKASLSAWVSTTTARNVRGLSDQVMHVSKGEGEFRLHFQIPEDRAVCGECGPSVSFYPKPSGESFLMVYLAR